ncbi:hypothetical protein [Flavobacterium sp. GCM10027622]|uniref:hypothetical protein n=1 Tax=unclassified Flavobacterium TaxID=196869 RepID=UPI003605CA13
MTKKEKLEYFKLVEAKLYEKVKDRTLCERDFEDLNINEKDAELFFEIYSDIWHDRGYDIEFQSEFWQNLDFEDNDFKLEFPDDRYFYQFGVTRLNIEKLKEELESKTRIIYINKITGDITIPQVVNPDETNIQKFIKLVIEDPVVFLEQLKKGEIDKILAYDKKNPTQWEIPKTHPLSEALEILKVDILIDILAEDKNWILYQNVLHLSNGMEFELKNFKSFNDFKEVKEHEVVLFSDGIKEHDKKTLENRFFFKVENPSKMRAELIKGNMKILDEIKNITFSSIFFTNNNEA